MKHKLKTTYCDKEDNCHEVVVHFEHYPGCRGARDSLGGKRGAGPPLEPDEDPTIEIEQVMLAKFGNGPLAVDVLEDLDPSQLDNITQQCWEHLIEMQQQDAPEPEPDWDRRPEPEELWGRTE